MKERVVAFLDIGTNSVRVLAVRLNPGYSYTILSRQKELVRLGEGEFTGRRYLRRSAMDRTVLVCRHFAELARSFGAEQVIAVATSATREAENQRILLDRLREEAGLDVSVVSGKEEARLTYLGVSSGIHLDDRQAIFIDIGGGSTEIAVGGQKEFCFLDSKQLGALRISTLFPPSGAGGRIGRKDYAAMRSFIDETLVGTAQALQGIRIDCAFGSSGTIENLAEIASRVYHPGESARRILKRDDLVKLIALLRSRSTEDRKKIPGMNPDRADIIVAGAAILESLMESLDLPEIHASDRGIREGLLMDFLEREEKEIPLRGLSVRRKSVLRLASLFRANEHHAAVTARLALALFDSSRDARLHALDERMREILEYAAILHDIGSYLSFDDHELHTYYFIRNGDLLGFSQAEVAMIANIAKYHRKYLSSRQAGAIVDLDRQSIREVQILANLLCLANSLDRSHTGVIADARITARSQREAEIELFSRNSCDLEVWGVSLHQKDFERTFHRRLKVTVHHASPGREEQPSFLAEDEGKE